MKILALESSSLSASVCVTEDGKLLAQAFQNCGMTHSATLLPMIDHMLKTAQIALSDLDAVAVTVGPGSFTGIRIGVSTAKGIADAKNLPCIPVSSLMGAAWNVCPLPKDYIICPVMDARRGQLYNALFSCSETGEPQRLTPDRLIQMEDLKAELLSLQNDSDNSHKKTILLVGDGGQMCYNNFISTEDLSVQLASAGLLYPCAYGTAAEAARLAQQGHMIPAAQLVPSYLRQPQAVRERLAREAASKS